MVASITTTAKGPLHQPATSKQRLPSCGAGRTPSPTKMRKRTLKRCCGLSMQACRTFPGYSTITRECPSVNTVPHSVCIIKIRKPLLLPFADRIQSLWEIQSNLAYTYVLLLEKRENILRTRSISVPFFAHPEVVQEKETRRSRAICNSDLCFSQKKKNLISSSRKLLLLFQGESLLIMSLAICTWLLSFPLIISWL